MVARPLQHELGSGGARVAPNEIGDAFAVSVDHVDVHAVALCGDGEFHRTAPFGGRAHRADVRGGAWRLLLPPNPVAQGHSLVCVVEVGCHIVAYRVAHGGVGLVEQLAEADEQAAHFIRYFFWRCVCV